MSNDDAQVARKAALDKKDADEQKASKDAQVALDAADA